MHNKENYVIPEDAGEYYDGLKTILSKFNDSYVGYISCDKGWYPLIISCDEELSAVCPDYNILQIKEKFGGLRYYIYAPEECDNDRVKMNNIIKSYEKLSAKTCEITGEPGVLMGETSSPFAWVKTLDPSKEIKGYENWVKYLHYH